MINEVNTEWEKSDRLTVAKLNAVKQFNKQDHKSKLMTEKYSLLPLNSQQLTPVQTAIQRMSEKHLDYEIEPVNTIRPPEIEYTQMPQALVPIDTPLSIICKHIPGQSDIDKIVKNIETCVIHSLELPIQAQDLIKVYQHSTHFCDIYQYTTDGKLPSSAKAQNCIRAKVLNYVVINHFLFRIDMQKDKDLDKGNLFLLVIPEKYEPIIFNTYHDSLLAGHQGPYRTAMTIRWKFFIHNLMNKVKRYIEACHTCLKTKPKYMKNQSIYGRIPVDYTPMQDLSIDIKMMPQAFRGYHLLLVITCDQTNFTIAVPLRDRTAQTAAEALIYRVIYLFRPPRQIICDEATEFSLAIIQAILCMLNCRLKLISPYNHSSSKLQNRLECKINHTLPALLPNKLNIMEQGPVTSGEGIRNKRAIPDLAIIQGIAAIGGMMIKGINALVDAKRASSFNNAIKLVNENVQINHDRLITLENRTAMMVKAIIPILKDFKQQINNTNDRLNRQYRMMTRAHDRYNRLFRQTHKTFQIHHLALLMVKDYITILVGTLQRIHRQYIRYESALDNTLIGIEHLNSGYLTHRTLDPKTLAKYLEAIKDYLEETAPEFELVFTNVYQYYGNSLISSLILLMIYYCSY